MIILKKILIVNWNDAIIRVNFADETPGGFGMIMNKRSPASPVAEMDQSSDGSAFWFPYLPNLRF